MKPGQNRVTVREPKGLQEFEQYYDLRWKILREPWAQPPESAKDEHEADAVHLGAWVNGELVGVGRLHFNNARFLEIEAETSRRAALRFVRLMLESMHILADKARQDAMFSDLAVYHAVSWLPPHGQRIGFVTEPFPDGLTT